MTFPEPAASQRELDMVRTRLEQIDVSGTRGVGVLQVQMTELVKDIGDLRAETRAWQVAHDREHEQERADRQAGRRWVVGAALAGFTAMIGALALLVDIAARVH
jgi:hypothetical protein